MLLRSIPPPAPPPPSTSSTSSLPGPSYPGLISTLRPLKKATHQLAEEALLLRRFTYKNKNQHKASGWWRKVVEVDRVVGRVKEELTRGVLGAFESVTSSSSGKQREEMGVITEQSLVNALLILPRSKLLVEKSLQVLLSTANILERLIHSRAFMAFALVIVSLVARLHSLCTVLKSELTALELVLGRLVAGSSLHSIYLEERSKLPKILRSDLLMPLSSSIKNPVSDPTQASLIASTSNMATSEETGSKIDRSELARLNSDRRTNPEVATTDGGGGSTNVDERSVGIETTGAGSGSRAKSIEEEIPSKGMEEGSIFPTNQGVDTKADATSREAAKVLGKRKKTSGALQATEGREEGEVAKTKKKKKKKVKEGDEIDDIFS